MSSIGKEKVIDDDNEEEDENVKLKRKSRDAKLDENLRVSREAEEREKATRKAEESLKAQKTIFPLWSTE